MGHDGCMDGWMDEMLNDGCTVWRESCMYGGTDLSMDQARNRRTRIGGRESIGGLGRINDGSLTLHTSSGPQDCDQSSCTIYL
jgi:hypothetical protein